MKRSEMLEKIKQKIEAIRGVNNGYYIYPDDDLLAESILQAVEENGMKAPLSKFCPVLLTEEHVWENE